MATRYAVGLPFTWNTTAGTKWATSSGGAGGASAPTSADDVVFDANSGSGAVTLGSGATCAALTFNSAFAGSMIDGGNTFNVYGSVTLKSGMTFTGAAGDFRMNATADVTTNGVTMPMNFLVVSGTTTLRDNFTVSGFVTISSGATLNTNGKTVSNTNSIDLTVNGTLTCGASAISVVKLTASSTATLNLDSSTISLTGTGTVITVNASATINAGTSTIKPTNSSSTAKTLSLAGKTYYNLWVATGSTGTTTITGSNTFNDIKLTNASGATLLTSGTTQTATSLTVAGAPGALITFRAVTASSAATISIASGTINVDYASIKDITATGGATFTATHSTNGGGNSGWTFVVSFFGFSRASRQAYLRR